MKNDRARTAELLIEAEMMPNVKRFAALFGNAGKLPSVAIITDQDAAYYGQRPVATKRVEALPRSDKHVR